MPWKATSPMHARMEFIDAVLAQAASIAALRWRFEFTRKTGYTWIGRHFEGCELVDRSSRRPKHGKPGGGSFRDTGGQRR